MLCKGFLNGILPKASTLLEILSPKSQASPFSLKTSQQIISRVRAESQTQASLTMFLAVGSERAEVRKTRRGAERRCAATHRGAYKLSRKIARGKLKQGCEK
jgi:hypothetical protein